MKEDTATLEFEFYPHCDDYQDVDLRFSVDPGMTLREYRQLCKRFALVMGYAEESVNELFGEDWE